MKKNRSITVVAASAAAILSLGFLGCSSPNSADGSTDGTTAETDNALKDTYVVSSDPSFVPFEFQEDGEQVGFNIELIDALSKRIGFEVDMQVMNFDGVIPGLQTGQIDIALGLITITEERAKTIDFSTPYFKGGYLIGVPVDNTDITSLEDLAGKRVATRLGSSSYDFLQREMPEATALPFEQLDQTYMAVENGDADAVVYDVPNIAYYVATAGAGKLKLVGDVLNAKYNGLGVSKGNEDLLAALNSELLAMFEDGSYSEIYTKWFDDEPPFLDDLIGQAETAVK